MSTTPGLFNYKRFLWNRKPPFSLHVITSLTSFKPPHSLLKPKQISSINTSVPPAILVTSKSKRDHTWTIRREEIPLSFFSVTRWNRSDHSLLLTTLPNKQTPKPPNNGENSLCTHYITHSHSPLSPQKRTFPSTHLSQLLAFQYTSLSEARTYYSSWALRYVLSKGTAYTNTV